MLFEPVELELDRKRKFKLNLRALMRAEREINRRRGAEVSGFASIDALILECIDSFRNRVRMPLDLLGVLLWSGLTDEDPSLTIDQATDLIEASPLSRADLVVVIFDHWIKVTKKADAKPNDSATDGVDADPLAARPGSTSGPLQ